MSAEVIHQAAALMRERAEAVNGESDEWWSVDGFAEVTNYEDAEHFVAFGRPAVALAVADWLDKAARAIDRVPDWIAPATPEYVFSEAFAIAHAYLEGSE